MIAPILASDAQSAKPGYKTVPRLFLLHLHQAKYYPSDLSDNSSTTVTSAAVMAAQKTYSETV